MNIPRTSLQQRAIKTTTEDKSNIVTIVTWATLVVSVLVFLARQCIKLAIHRRKAGIDDLFMLTATIFAVGLSVTVLILASDGLGVLDVLTVRKADLIQKGYYASEFLYILTIGFAKLCLVSFFYSVSHHQRGQRRAVLAIGIFILAWTLASLAAVAFQCGLPKPWEILTLHCYNIGVFWIVYCIVDMTSDVAIVMLSINLVAYLKVRLSRKIAVVACFAPRILVIGVALARLVYLFPISPHNNPAFHLWVPLIITQVQACLSIVTACIPYVRAFFETSDASLRRRSTARSKHATVDEESYGCCGYPRGYKKAHGNSTDSTAFANSPYGRTSDASPRIPSPAPVSPLEARFDTPPDTSASGSRTPSERGLRLVIPEHNETHHGSDLTSPQTASSNALSPAYPSPHPLLSSIALTHVRSSTLPAADAARSRSAMDREKNVTPSPSRPQPPRRFSLFPTQQQYSLLPQQRARPPLTTTSPTVERSCADDASPMRHMPVGQIPETRGLSPNAPLPVSRTPRLMFPPRPSSSLERVAYDDPLRTGPIVMTTSEAVPAPMPVAIPVRHDTTSTDTSVPSYYVRPSSTAHNSTFSSPQSVPSYYIRTPPTTHPPAFPQSNPYAYEAPPPPPIPPTSPQRQRNKRILTPQNSSRPDQMSPISPMTPSTPRSLWREENGNRSVETPKSPHGWDQAPIMPMVQDVRNSPRIVVQRFS
ncbi:uncharacterized protein CC84DRAFT_1129779 [Paraphaeosphaeria sporulosa]|uniref:Rhodopsin domain-containing protein n=1 Tax=Paraphaeosphaeria sporulosa TaxID=1460663 RepID=A0A177BYC6_9PLEO|nr:uncharacterized protein CC84DRAFT_1129779 [Paraphaeosphaeria sporulosa]OAF99950.1 hypothetical protein CC84DRAFT_1129779 [Paraphaeosphaeria sporulosa]